MPEWRRDVRSATIGRLVAAVLVMLTLASLGAQFGGDLNAVVATILYLATILVGIGYVVWWLMSRRAKNRKQPEESAPFKAETPSQPRSRMFDIKDSEDITITNSWTNADEFLRGENVKGLRGRGNIHEPRKRTPPDDEDKTEGG